MPAVEVHFDSIFSEAEDGVCCVRFKIGKHGVDTGNTASVDSMQLRPRVSDISIASGISDKNVRPHTDGEVHDLTEAEQRFGAEVRADLNAHVCSYCQGRLQCIAGICRETGRRLAAIDAFQAARRARVRVRAILTIPPD